jgi:hypothetical protein
MLIIESSERKSCEEIWRCLDEMYQNCVQDDDYATSSHPWRIDGVAVPHPVGLEQLNVSKEVEHLVREKLVIPHRLRHQGKLPRRETPRRIEQRSSAK